MTEYKFKTAVPVWEENTESEMNYNLCFRTIIPKLSEATIALTASNSYQMFVNGIFVTGGPARAGHGYYRVDEIDLTQYLTDESNIISLYVDGYNSYSFYLLNQPAFLCAEVISNGNVISATGDTTFEAKYHSDRIRKVLQYSYQRTFTEAYNYDEDYKAFETDPNCGFIPVKLVPCKSKNFITRDIPYLCHDKIVPSKIMNSGNVSYSDSIPNPIRDRVTVPEFDDCGFSINDVDIICCDELDKCKCTPTSSEKEYSDNSVLESNQFITYTFPCEKTAYINVEVECSDDTTIIAVFDETLSNGDIDIRRTQPGDTIMNIVIWNLKKGSYSLMTNEMYSFKYLRLINKSDAAKITLKNVYITEFANSVKYVPLGSDNEKLNTVYKAAFETFRQNAVDIYTDCPSRERAGWLCDSFFTARTEKELTGKSLIERNFLEHFVVNESPVWKDKPMIPMCYPAEGRAASYIPQWAMWYVLELEEYYQRSSDRTLVDIAKNKINALMTYFEGFENEDGLLENLEGWRFIEWSKANELVDGVNYPTNMLYAKALEAVHNLYGTKGYCEKAKKIKKTVCEQAYINGFFHDQALRDESGNLYTTSDVTETCQYYAFFTNTATPQTHPTLWNTLISDFGPEREAKGLWKEIYPSNAFIGYFLRIEILAVNGMKEQVLDNIEGFFYPMAEETGTLWEHKTTSASCCHGFASYVIVLLNKFAKKD